MAERIIAVMGATGAQGGGLVRAIAADPGGGFTARAITRDPQSERARAVAALGAELVQADLDDQASLERAFAGAHGAFCVTNFWEHFSPHKELDQARNAARAAKAAGVVHLVWSTLEDTRAWVPLDDDRMPTLGGEWKVPHFDAKGTADAVFAEAGVPTTYLRTSFYWDNFFGMGPRRGEDGKLAIALPIGDKRLAGIAAEDIGKAAYGIFKAGDAYIGKTIGIVGEALSGDEMAARLSEALGEPVRYDAIPPEVYRGLGFPGAEDLGNMFQVKRDFETEYLANRDAELTRRLNPQTLTFRGFLDRNANKLAPA